MGPLSIEQVLAAEVIALNGVATGERGGDPRPQATEQDAQSRRMKKDADVRSGADENPDEVEKRKTFYRSLNKLNRAALSLSGGGIRSATFCLGVIQALAAYDVAPAPAEGEEKSPSLPENSLLGRFQYLHRFRRRIHRIVVVGLAAARGFSGGLDRPYRPARRSGCRASRTVVAARL
jgi:hypothetical protein